MTSRPLRSVYFSNAIAGMSLGAAPDGVAAKALAETAKHSASAAGEGFIGCTLSGCESRRGSPGVRYWIASLRASFSLLRDNAKLGPRFLSGPVCSNHNEKPPRGAKMLVRCEERTMN